MNNKLIEIDLPRSVWSSFGAKEEFYNELNEMLQFFEAGLITKRKIRGFVNRKGLKIDFSDYSLKFYTTDNTGFVIKCPLCKEKTTVSGFWWAYLECLKCENISAKERWLCAESQDNVMVGNL